MKLTTSEIVTNTKWTRRYPGNCDWGTSYMFGPNTEGWIADAWYSSKYGSDRMFRQGLLDGSKS